MFKNFGDQDWVLNSIKDWVLALKNLFEDVRVK